MYPWSPLLIVANTLGAQILAAVAVPLVVLWKAPAKRRVLGETARAVGTYMLFQAATGTAAMLAAGWLRRHLMLYRIFSPRFMLGAVVVLVGEVVVVLIALGGVRWNVEAVGEVFGFLG